MRTSIVIIFIFIFNLILRARGQDIDNEEFSICQNSTFVCGGTVQPIQYPFWGNNQLELCGHRAFELKCHDNNYTYIDIDTHKFHIFDINPSNHTMTLARSDLWDNHCVPRMSLKNSSIDSPLFRIAPMVRNLNIYYGCSLNVTSNSPGRNFTCDMEYGYRERDGFVTDESFARVQVEDRVTCEVGIEVPVLSTSLEGLLGGSVTLQAALNMGFMVVHNAEISNCLRCRDSGGLCGSDPLTQEFRCLCRDQTYDNTCKDPGDGFNKGVKIIIAFASAGVSIIFMSIIFYIYHRRQKKYYTSSSGAFRDISSNPSSLCDLEKAGSCMGVQMFSYIELETATNKFDSKLELGDGGFGTVYQGKLRDGRVVAVKRLYENNFKRVEQFMNEVEILTRLRHQNLVTLYGCTSRHSRELLLVYEYIPNGTLADHLHGELAKPGSLTWLTRMSIAIETASALAYLHASDVIHRDIKTTNILLDNNFSVKVADFGLSRDIPTHVTHVSTTPQGTPGYVDPEYHQCYQLTDKSDVYSFGVVLAELISSKPAVDISRHRHEINLSNLAINKIQSNALHEFVDESLEFESDERMRNMITQVAQLTFQCLQGGKEMRPSMEEVWKRLKEIKCGDTEDIEKKKGKESDTQTDGAVLLKSDSLTRSPNSVTATWASNSNSTTPRASQ